MKVKGVNKQRCVAYGGHADWDDMRAGRPMPFPGLLS